MILRFLKQYRPSFFIKKGKTNGEIVGKKNEIPNQTMHTSVRIS